MGKGSSGATFCEVLIAILLPPLGVFLKYGCGLEFWLCLLLTLFAYVPGILYALYVIVA
ncbi:unnamed protein product [Sphagnum jensenii]|jgi:uncharacterized membrane protein YqaE (UPF0057 family)|uniref:Uncharacterized protein n=1 Tax=Sphagnum jensenii TaxID=128206 RepID=A0ABP0W356_9BRYO